MEFSATQNKYKCVKSVSKKRGRSASIIRILIKLENFKIEISNSNSSIHNPMFFLSIKKISGVSSGKTINKIVRTAQ